MTQANGNWADLSERLEGLALKLKLHLQQTGGGEVPDVLSRLRASVVEAFDAAGNAVKDEAVRSDVREIGRLLADAASTTFNRVTGEVKDLMDRKS